MSFVLGNHRADYLGVNGGASGSLNTTGADLILIAVASGGSGLTPTDSKSNTWTLVAEYNSNGQYYSDLYFCPNPTTDAAHTFTVTGTGFQPTIGIACFTGSNASPNDVHDGKGNVFVDSIQATTGITPSVANPLIISMLQYSRAQGVAYSVDSGIAIIDFNESSPSSTFLIWGYKVQTSATFINPTWGPPTFTGNIYISTEVASFKPATGGGSTDQLDWKRRRDPAIDLNYGYDIIRIN